MRKVCIVTTVHSPFDDRIFYKEAVSLAENGYTVVLIARHERNLVSGGVRIRAIPDFSSKWRRVLTAPVHAIRLMIEEKADVYHIHDPEIYWLGIVARTALNKKVVFDIHENYYRIIKAKRAGGIFTFPCLWLYRLYEKMCLASAAAIICAVPDISNNYKRVKTKKEEIRNFPEIKPLPVKTSTRPTTTFVYVGEISEERGILETIEAFEKVLREGYKAKLKLIGPVKMDPACVARASRNSQIEITGLLDRSEVFRNVRASDVGLCLLHPKENFLNAYPVKIFEYMACGIPVIASDFETLKNFIERNQCGFNVNPADIHQIASVMEYLINHPAQAKAMGENGMKRVKEEYNWDIEKTKLLNLYRNLQNA